MNIEFVKAIIQQPQKTWGNVVQGVIPSVIQVGTMQLYLNSMGMGGNLFSVSTVVSIAAGAMWTVGIGETLWGTVRSAFILKAAISRINWCFKSVPSHPSAAFARGRLQGIQRDIAAFGETSELQAKAEAERAIIRAYDRNPEAAAIIGGVNWRTCGMVVNSLWTVATSGLAGLAILFQLSKGAFTQESFAALQLPGLDAATTCAGSTAHVAQRVQDWRQAAGLGAKSLGFLAKFLPTTMILMRVADELSSGGMRALKRSLPYHCFILGWYGLTPVAPLNVMLQVPLVGMCAYEVFWRKRYGIEKITPQGTESASVMDILTEPTAEFTGLGGIVAKCFFSHLSPQLSWRFQSHRISEGLNHLTAIRQDGLNCALWAHLKQ